MSKKINYAETRLIKSKQNRKFGGFFAILLSILMVGCMVAISGVLSGFLTIADIGLLFNNKNVINSHSYYMVVMGEYNNLADAETVASGAAVMGAASYVWNNNNKFFVVGNIYKTKEDANKVCEQIKNTANYNIFVKQIDFKKLNISNKNYTTEQLKTIVDSIKFIGTIYEKTYDYGVKIDKNEIAATQVSSELNNIKSQVKIFASKLDSINSVSVSETTINIKNAYIKIVDALDSAILKVINGSSVNKDIKYLTCTIVDAKYNLYQNI